jgi:hypothetical protein
MVVRLLSRAKGSVVRVLNRSRYRFSPTDLGADLLAWWDAEQPATITGSAVSSWADVVAGYTATQAVGGSQPIYSATSFNGRRGGITFDGTAAQLTCLSAGLLAQLGGSASYEMWAAVDQTALVADTTVRCVVSVGAANTTSRRMNRLIAAPGVNRASTTTGDGVGSTTATNSTVVFFGRHVVRSQITATQTMTEVDSVAMAPAAVVPATTATRVRIGAAANTAASAFWQGVVNTVLITRPLSTAQVNQLNAYLGIRTF